MHCVTRFLVIMALLLSPLTASTATAAPAKQHTTITMETNLGPIVIELYDAKAPISAANFRTYVREKFYDGLIFHRVIPGFVIQGGGFEPGMKRRPATHPAIKNEATNGLKNLRGTLSMARTNRVNSATSQFFINLKHNRSLDHRDITPPLYGYAVFGKVIKGMEVVDKIAATPTGRHGMFRDVPQQEVIIKKAYEN